MYFSGKKKVSVELKPLYLRWKFIKVVNELSQYTEVINVNELQVSFCTVNLIEHKYYLSLSLKNVSRSSYT